MKKALLVILLLMICPYGFANDVPVPGNTLLTQLPEGSRIVAKRRIFSRDVVLYGKHSKVISPPRPKGDSWAMPAGVALPFVRHELTEAGLTLFSVNGWAIVLSREDGELPKTVADFNTRLGSSFQLLYPGIERSAAAQVPDTATSPARNTEGAQTRLSRQADPKAGTAGISSDEKDMALGQAAHTGDFDGVKRLLASGANPVVQIQGTQPIHVAAIRGHVGIVNALLAAGAKADTAFHDGRQPVHLAAAGGHLEVVQVLMNAGAKLDVSDKFAARSFVDAAAGGHTEMVKFLLAKGVKVDGKVEERQAIHAAAARGHTEVLKVLLAAGADPVAQSGAQGRDQPIHLAAGSDVSDALKVLLSAGAKLDVVDAEGRQPIHRTTGAEMIRTLIAMGAKADARTVPDETQPIHIAAKNGQVAAVDALISAGAKVDARTKDGLQAIHHAASSAKPAETMKALLAAGANVNARAKDGLQPIHIAAQGRSPEAIALLLAAGAKIDATSDNGWQPLHFAAMKGDGIKTLLAAGAQVNARAKDGSQPIHIAARGSSPEAIALLLAAGAKIDATNDDGWQPLHFAAKANALVAMNALLAAGARTDALTRDGRPPIYFADSIGSNRLQVAAGTNPGASTDDKNTALIVAVQIGDTDKAKRLLDSGARLDSPGKDGKYPIQIALAEGDIPMIKLLLAAGARLDGAIAGKASPDADAPLICAASRSNKAEVVRTLLAAGAKVDTLCKDNRQPIHHAAGAAPVAVVKVLLAAGAKVDAVDIDRRQPLHVAAAESRDVEVVKALLDARARIDAGDKNGEQAIHYAARRTESQFVRLLLAAGAKVDAASKNGAQPLHAAAGSWLNTVETVKVLLAAGASLTAADGAGKQAVDLAAEQRNSPKLALLLAAGSPADTAAARTRMERRDKQYEILSAVEKPFNARTFGYECNAMLGSFPDRYDDLQNPSRARNNWNKARAIANSFNACVRAFTDAASRISIESRVPVYRLMTNPEKMRVNQHYQQGIDSVRELIERGRADIAEELRLIEQSQGRMEGAAEASRRSAAENRMWMQDLTRSLNELADRLKPPPALDRAEFDRRIAEQEKDPNSDINRYKREQEHVEQRREEERNALKQHTAERERARAEQAKKETANIAANEARLRTEADRAAKQQEHKREQDRAAAAEARTRAAAEAARQEQERLRERDRIAAAEARTRAAAEAARQEQERKREQERIAAAEAAKQRADRESEARARQSRTVVVQGRSDECYETRDVSLRLARVSATNDAHDECRALGIGWSHSGVQFPGFEQCTSCGSAGFRCAVTQAVHVCTARK